MRKVTVNFSDGRQTSSSYGTNTSSGTYKIFPNDWCCVDPANPLKKKHRGRVCQFTGNSRERKDMAGKPSSFSAVVRFSDTGKIGYVDASDLVPASPEQIPIEK
jgi:uncharacterized OB-fold protein